MSNNNNDNNNDNDDILDFDQSESNQAVLFKDKTISVDIQHYKLDPIDMDTIKTIINEFPNHNPLDILNCFKLLEQNRLDKNFFSNIVKELGISNITIEEY